VTSTYYPIQKRWRKLRPLFEQLDIIELMHHEMECYASSRADDYGYKHRPKPFSLDVRPADYDSCDWRWSSGRRGPQPGYWAWACHSACHWVASANLVVISQLEPDRPWRIATSSSHTTVVDMERRLMFDTNYLALGVSAEECWAAAVEADDSDLFPIGETMKHWLPDEEDVAA